MDSHTVIGQLHSAAPGVVLTMATDGPTGERGITEVSEAFRCLQGLFVPLEAALELEAVDPELGLVLDPVDLDTPHHLLRAPMAPHVAPRPRLADPIVRTVSQCDAATLETWMRDALRAESAGDLEIAWCQLVVTAARLRASETLGATAAFENLESQPFEVPVTQVDGAWLEGPTAHSSLDPPVRVTFLQEGHVTRLEIAVVWPLWSRPGSAGRAALAECIRQLLAFGWSIERADGVFADVP